jgi:hypothetical protein
MRRKRSSLSKILRIRIDAASESAPSCLPLGFGPRRGRSARCQLLLLGQAAGERHALRALRYNRRRTCFRTTALKSAKETENEKRLQAIRHDKHVLPAAEVIERYVGVQDDNAANRVADMDDEGTDVHFLVPGGWSSLIGVDDVSSKPG